MSSAGPVKVCAGCSVTVAYVFASARVVSLLSLYSAVEPAPTWRSCPVVRPAVVCLIPPTIFSSLESQCLNGVVSGARSSAAARVQVVIEYCGA